MSRLEIEEYGVHHGHLGGWLAKEWNLPYKFQLAARYHIDPESCSKHHTFVNLIHDAARITKQGVVDQWGETETPFDFTSENHLAQMNILPSIQDIPEIEHLFIREQQRAMEFISHIRANA
jgi:HD-like signal output (HDOD) protein